MPAKTVLISQPAMISASSTAFLMPSMVASTLITTPFLKPRDG